MRRLPFQSLFELRSGNPLRDPALARAMGMMREPTAAGISVSEDTALNIAAYWRGVQLISGQLGAMPLHFYKGDKDGAKAKYTKSNLYKLLHDAPNREMSAFSFRETLQAHLLTWGNAYAEIEWNGALQPIGLWPITPDRVRVFRDRSDLRIKYLVAPGNRVIEAEDILHVPGLGFDGLIGYSVIARARQSLGLSAATERFGATFFGNGSTFGGLLTTDDPMEDPVQRKELRDDIQQIHQGPDRAHKFMLLYGGMKYERIGIPPEDAQFLETRKFQTVEICRWLGVPPHKLYDLERSTNNNIEHQAIEYYTDTIWMWLEKWEQEFNRKLVPNLEQNYQFFEFDFNGVLRTDTQSRFSSYQIGRQGGWLSINDIRRKENENPVVGGDGYLAPMNMVPLDKFSAFADKQITPPPAAADTVKALSDQAAAAAQRADASEQAATEARALAATLDAQVTTLRATDATRQDALVHAERTADEQRQVAEALTAQEREARRDADRLREQLEAAQRTQAETDARLAAAEAARTDVEVRQAATVAELAADRDRWTTERAALETAVRDATREAETRAAAARELTATLEAAQTREQELRAQIEGRLIELRGAEVGRDEARAELARVTAIADAAPEELRAATTSVEAAIARALAAEAALEETRAAVAAAGDARFAVEAAHAGALERCATAEAALAAAEQRQSETAETVRALAARIDGAEQLAAAQATTVLEAQAGRALAERARDEAIARETTLADRAGQAELRAAEIAAAQAQQFDVERRRVAAILTEHRALVVDTMRRMIDREIDRARRAQASPEKLRSWIDPFYQGHEALCVAALLPAIRVHVAWSGRSDDPDTLTRDLIRQHIEDSKRQLAAVADGDADALAASLYALCERWQRDRVETIATRLLQQEIDHART